MQKPFVISRIARDDNNDGELLNVYLDAVTVGPSRMQGAREPSRSTTRFVVIAINEKICNFTG